MALQHPSVGDYIAMLERAPETFQHAWDALAIYDLEGRLVTGNAAARELVGKQLARSLIGRHFTKHLKPDTVRRATRAFEACLSSGRPIEGEVTFCDPRGEPIPVRVKLSPARVNGTIVGVIGFGRDVRSVRSVEQERRDRASAREAKRVGDLYAVAAAPMLPDEKIRVALDLACVELRATAAYAGRLNEGMLEIRHVSGQMPGYRVGDRRPAEETSAPLTADDHDYGAIGFARPSRRVRLSTSDRVYVRAIATLINSAVQQDVRDRQRDTLAFHDALTGLPNRALLTDRLERALLAARRNGCSFAVHYIDIDHFKAINDCYGHYVGDRVLVTVAQWLQSTLRDSDTVARVGGDEFVVLQPEIGSIKQAEDLGARLGTIREQHISVGTIDVAVHLSIGIAVFPGDGLTPVDILCAADAALYEVKKRGRDGYAVGLR